MHWEIGISGTKLLDQKFNINTFLSYISIACTRNCITYIPLCSNDVIDSHNTYSCVHITCLVCLIVALQLAVVYSHNLYG